MTGCARWRDSVQSGQLWFYENDYPRCWSGVVRQSNPLRLALAGLRRSRARPNPGSRRALRSLAGRPVGYHGRAGGVVSGPVAGGDIRRRDPPDRNRAGGSLPYLGRRCRPSRPNGLGCECGGLGSLPDGVAMAGPESFLDGRTRAGFFKPTTGRDGFGPAPAPQGGDVGQSPEHGPRDGAGRRGGH